MYSGDVAPARREKVLRYLSGALLVYGAVGAASLLRLPTLLWEGIIGWLGPRPTAEAPTATAWLEPLYAHFSARPWLPWLAWLVGFGVFLALYKKSAAVEPDEEADAAVFTARTGRFALVLISAIILIAAYARLATLVPPDVGVSQFPYDDEGVNAGASQLFVQGVMPYRDYFFAHPPFAAVTFAPAMLYRFNEWGSPTSFMNARYLSVAYSLLVILPLFYIGFRLAGLWGGSIGGLLWALDGRVIEINRKVMLDTPMVLFACAALALYLWARSDRGEDTSRKKGLILAGVGAFGALAALTKITGIACLIAILADMVWLNIEARRLQSRGGGSGLRQAAWLFGGAAVVSVPVVLPSLITAPSELIRQVFFFQLLRPTDGLADVPARVNDLTATLGNALTPLFAALGFLIVSAAILMRMSSICRIAADALRPLVLWLFFTFFLFTFSRSFYPHYYIQIAAPLCLLGAGVGLLRPLLGMNRIGKQRANHNEERRAWRLAPAVSSTIAVITLISLPLVVSVWEGIVTRREDRIFEIVARYVTDAVPPGTPVLTTDEQFNLLAGRPPSRNSSGYLVDSYGHMIYLGMSMSTRSWGDLLGDLVGGPRSNDAYAAMHTAAAQNDILDRASRASLIVIHDRGLARITDPTLERIREIARQEVDEARYDIYRGRQP